MVVPSPLGPQSPCCCQSSHGHHYTVASVTTTFPASSITLKYKINGCESKVEIDSCQFMGSMFYGDFVG